ncbi:MAG: nucleotidyltransferase family protein [Bacteroidales bacterium]|nr:nucleotidyltransferase family protein [Bacteroidales bacterium]
MNRLQTYYFIGNLLSSSFNAKHKESLIQEFKSPDFNWSLFIALGSNHLVLQIIYCKLLGNQLTEYLPAEVNSHLREIYDLNLDRNMEIIKQIKAINLLLNSHGIAPLYMKGAGNIIDSLYSDLPERLMHDIDILVPGEHLEPVITALLNDGYRSFSEIKPEKLKTAKHYPPLSKTGNKVTLEVHRFPVGHQYTKIINTDEIWKERKQIDDYGTCYVMSDHHKIIHNFVHSQLMHHGHSYARVHLRDLYDLLMLTYREDIGLCLKGLKGQRNKAFSYLGLMQKVFQKESTERTKRNLFVRLYYFRYEINLRSRIFSLINFLIAIMFRSYIIIPIRSLKDKERRNSLPKKLFEKNWYKRHYRSLTRISKNKN